jgi:hypothetical protein
MGQIAHKYFEVSLAATIQLRYAQVEGRATYSDRALKTIVEGIKTKIITGDPAVLLQQVPDVDELASPSKRSDFVVHNPERSHVDVYELKPMASATGYKYEAAKIQINGYKTELSNTGLRVQGGDELITGIPLPFPEAGRKATITFTADPGIKGLYYYKIDDGNE